MVQQTSSEHWSPSAIAEISATLAITQFRQARSVAVTAALHLLGWLVFGLVLWTAVSIISDMTGLALKSSSRPWFAIIPLAAAILSLVSAFRSDRELRQAEHEWTLSRIAALTREPRD